MTANLRSPGANPRREHCYGVDTHLRFSKYTHTHTHSHSDRQTTDSAFTFFFLFLFLSRLLTCYLYLCRKRSWRTDRRIVRQASRQTIHEQHWIWEQYKYTLFRNSECIITIHYCNRTMKDTERDGHRQLTMPQLSYICLFFIATIMHVIFELEPTIIVPEPCLIAR